MIGRRSAPPRERTSREAEPVGPRPQSVDPVVTMLVVMAAGLGAGVAAVAAGQLRVKLLGGLVVAVIAVIVIRMFKDRQRVLLVAGVPLALGFLLHKSFGAIVNLHDGGAPSVAVTTLDAVVLVLYGMWWHEGALRRDLHELVERPIFWVPWIAALLCLVSALNASSLRLVVAEVLRWFFMYLLFVYIALRVRSRQDVALLLTGLGALGVMELGFIVLQWKTGGVLGLSFLGVPTALDVRTIDAGTIGRPFGSFTHPVFMAAIMGVFSLAALSLAIFIDRPTFRWRGLHGRRVRIALVVLGLAFAAPMMISHTRSAALGYAVALPVLIAIGVKRGKVTRRGLAWMGVALIVLVTAGWPVIYHYYTTDIASNHFPLEVQAREQLNSLAAHIWRLNFWSGIGLNNFQQVMDSYNTRNLIFDGNPVHNLILLQGSETGILGVIGMGFIGVALFGLAAKLSRVRDSLLMSVGIIAVIAYVFWFVEELLEFSLREDAPLAVFWILAGLVVASLRIASADAPDPQLRAPADAPQEEAQVAPRVLVATGSSAGGEG